MENKIENRIINNSEKLPLSVYVQSGSERERLWLNLCAKYKCIPKKGSEQYKELRAEYDEKKKNIFPSTIKNTTHTIEINCSKKLQYEEIYVDEPLKNDQLLNQINERL